MFEKIVEYFDSFYDMMYSNYEKWLAVPIIILVLTGGILGYSYMQDGELVPKGIEFTGGTEIQVAIPGEVSQQEIEEMFGEAYSDVNVRTISSGDSRNFIIRTSGKSADAGEQSQIAEDDGLGSINTTDQVENILKRNNVEYGEIGIQTVGAAVSGSFLFEAQLATAFAFLVMSVVIFVAFRSLVPSLAVIAAAFIDIVAAIAGMNLLGINLTLGSLAALLMLIGYSVDTDIVLSTKILRERQRDLKERVKDSITTGVTMTAGAIAAFTVLYIVSTSPTLDQIAAVILMGLLIDIPATWTGNAIILKMHAEGKI